MLIGPSPVVGTKGPQLETNWSEAGVIAVKLTLSNVAVHKAELLWAVTAKPIYAVVTPVNVALPACVQLVPSGEQ